MKTETYQLQLTFIEPLLGSQATRDVTTRFIAAKAGIELPEDEIETLPDALELATTVFHHDDANNPLLYDYHVKGMLKTAGQVFNGRVSGGVKNLRKKIADNVFVTPRRIKLVLANGDEPDILERPLRAQTAQGERVALARSEMLPVGVSCKCGITVYPGGGITEEVLRELLDYGYHAGVGQWRSGGFGRFTYTLTREEDDA